MRIAGGIALGVGDCSADRYAAACRRDGRAVGEAVAVRRIVVQRRAANDADGAVAGLEGPALEADGHRHAVRRVAAKIDFGDEVLRVLVSQPYQTDVAGRQVQREFVVVGRAREVSRVVGIGMQKRPGPCVGEVAVGHGVEVDGEGRDRRARQDVVGQDKVVPGCAVSVKGGRLDIANRNVNQAAVKGRIGRAEC